MEYNLSDFNGTYAGQFDPEEYEPFIASGQLRKVYRGGAGLLGLAKLEQVFTETDDSRTANYTNSDSR